MIVSQARKVRKQLETLKRLEEDERNRRDIEATHAELKQVAAALHQFGSIYQLIHSLLDPQQTAYVTDQIARIDEDVESSRQAFAQQRRQVKTLQSIKNQIDALDQRTKASWKLYAEEQLKPQVELLSLVRQLPEMRGQLNTIDSQTQRLEEFKDTPPNNVKELKEFEQKLQSLTERLASLSLQPAIRNFLTKVLGDEATLADLSEEVLNWCQQGNRAKTFKITFK
jgi:hypothetical protein